MTEKDTRPILIRRRDAAQQTVDRFNGVRFKWSTNDCVRMAAFHTRKMGYVPPAFPKAGSYKDAKGAMRQLQKVTGFPRIERVLEVTMGFMSMPWSYAITGDLMAIRSEDEAERDWPALAVVLDNHRVLTFLSDGENRVCGVAVPKPEFILNCWKVEPA